MGLVLSSAKLTRASWGYYVRQEPCRASDYYLGHDQDDGLWLGRGLERLGIEPGSVVTEQQLEALFGRAINPDTGLQLGRAWRADGVTGYDLTFSAPKSVSALTTSLAPSLPGVLEHLQDPEGPEGPVGAGAGRQLELPGLGSDCDAVKPERSQAMTDLLVESALDGQREQIFQAAQARGQAGLRSVAPAADVTTADVVAAQQPDRRSAVTPKVLPSQVRGLVVAAHDTATRTALTYLDRHASLSRRGTDGAEQVTSGGFTVAAFTHYTSREGDPQLHTHALVLNKVQCADGTWRTLDGHELYAHKKSAGMIYQAVLRNELTRTLGVEFGEVSKDGQAEILGISEPLLEKWSKRTHAVTAEATSAIAELEAKLERTLTTDERAAVTKTAVLKTRPDKTHEHPEALSQRWAAEAAALGVDLTELLPAAQRAAHAVGPSLPVPSGEELAAAALTRAGRSRAVFDRAEVAGHVAALLPTTGLAAAEVLATVERVTDQALNLTDAVSLGAPVNGATPRLSDARYATIEVLHAEQRILHVADHGLSSGAGRVGFDVTRKVLSHVPASGGELDRSQVEALLHLTSRGNTLDVLTAPAGAGKTATLGACAAAWHHAGYRVIGLAPSARAAAELHTAISRPASGTGESVASGENVGSRTDTLAKWLHTRATHPDLDHAASTEPGAAPTASSLGRGGWARLDSRTVLVVDEASMASTLDLDTLTQAARAAGAKVVLVGDPGQIGVIDGPGGMLATLTRHDHLIRNDNRPGFAVALTSIHRFSQEWEKQASLLLRDGHRDALQPYLQQQRLHPCPDGDAAADAVFAHWQHATSHGADALMLARTRVDVDSLNQRARAAFHTAAAARGDLTGPALTLGGRDWQPGDLLRTRKNNRQLHVGGPDSPEHVRNGDRWRVLGPHPDDGLVVEDLAGRGRTTLPAGYVAKHCEYGWAATIDGSQGATCDLGLLLARPGLDREHLYVGMTRGRHGNHSYLTPDPALAPDSHLPEHPGKPRDNQQLERDCLATLQTALAVSGAQDSATTALARTHTSPRDLLDSRSQDAAAMPPPTHAGPDQEPEPAAAPVRAAVSAALPPSVPDELAAKRAALQARLEKLEQHAAELRSAQNDIYQRRPAVTGQLQTLPRWAVTRRRQLTAELAGLDQQTHDLQPQRVALDRDINSSREQLRRLDREERTARRASTTARPAAALRAGTSTTATPARTTGSPDRERIAALAAAAARGEYQPRQPVLVEPDEPREDSPSRESGRRTTRSRGVLDDDPGAIGRGLESGLGRERGRDSRRDSGRSGARGHSREDGPDLSR